MAKKVELKERYTNEVMYPVTLTDCILDLDLNDYYNKSEVDLKISDAVTEGIDLTTYATKQWVEDKHYLTEHLSLDNYPTKEEMSQLIAEAVTGGKVDLTAYATKSWVQEQNYLTQHQDLTEYAKSADVTNEIKEKTKNFVSNSELEDKLEDYATQQWVRDLKYLTKHQDLSGYAKQDWVNTTIDEKLGDEYYTKSEVDNLIESALLGGGADAEAIEALLKNYINDVELKDDKLNFKHNTTIVKSFNTWDFITWSELD